jgi:elongation factor Ts
MVSASLIKDLREKTNAGMLDCKKALEATDGNIDAAIDWLREKGVKTAAKKADRIAAEGLAAIKIDGNVAAIVEVNSETDFVAKNSEFTSLVDSILDAIIENNVNSVDELLNVSYEDGTINDLIVSKTATIGEKLSLRRFERIEKSDNESFGDYIHMGGRIAVLTVLDGASSEVAKDVSMHSAAMRPQFVKSSDVPTDTLEKEKKIIKELLIKEGKPEKIIDEKIMPGKVDAYYEEVCLENQKFVKGDGESVAEFVKNNGGSIVTMIRYEVGEGIEKKEENFAEEVAKQIQGA